MITLKLQGRLGNQLFQYAFAKSLKNKYYPKEDIFINLSSYKKYNDKDGWENSLKYFNISELNYTNHLNINFFQVIVLYIYLCYRAIARRVLKLGLNTKDFEMKYVPFLNKLGIYCLNTGYYDFKKSKFKNKIIVGCFECDKYFNEIKDILFEEYTPKQNLRDKNIDFYNLINSTESVCVSIRRGDFLSQENKKDFFVCDDKYFDEAIKIIQSNVKNPTFFVFSDDVEWVKENMRFPQSCYYETEDNPVWEKIRLMYSCKHFIISNSTFSWWTQYLSKNKDKIVVAPGKWNNKINHKDIYQDNWILVDVG